MASLEQVVGLRAGGGMAGRQARLWATAGILICFDFWSWSLERGLATRPIVYVLGAKSRQRALERVLEAR